MATTTKGIRYPIATDPFAPHLDIQRAAEDVDVRLPAVLPEDAGFPVAVSVTTTEGVLSRITVPAQAWAQRISAVGSAWLRYTQTNDLDLIIYADAVSVGRSRANMTLDVGKSVSVVSTPILAAAGTGIVIELRVFRFGGTGTVTSSISSGLTTLQATTTVTV